MRNLILFDDETRVNLLPLTFTRPVSELRTGILPIREKWERRLNGRASHITVEYLTKKFPIRIEANNLIINGSVLPNDQLVELVKNLEPFEALVFKDELVAASIPGSEFDALIDGSFGDEISGFSVRQTPVDKIERTWDLYVKCADEIACDFALLTKGRSSNRLSTTNNIFGNHMVFVEDGVECEYVTINTTKGPVFIGEGSVLMEGSMVRGPVAIGKNNVLKLGAKIYGPCGFGPFTKIGGEVNTVIVQGHSNKSHEGFLGNSYIGEWCNFGADSNTSNLKNTYSEVNVWNYQKEDFEPSGRIFCGLIMGDHSKCGINTMFNTGTVVGVHAGIYGVGFPEKFVPSFTWGGIDANETYRLDKSLETARAVMARRDFELTDVDKDILKSVFDITAQYRHWEQ